jgi:hypothetical protein
VSAPADAGSPGSEPAGAPSAGAAPDSLLQTLASLARELPGLVSDRVDLLALELTRMGRALSHLVLMLVAVAVLSVTAWLVLWGAFVKGLLALGLPMGVILVIILLVNLGSIALLLVRMRSLLPRLKLPATRRHLTLSLSTEPRPTDTDHHRHDLHDLSRAGQPPVLWPLLPPTWRDSVPPPLRQLARGLGVPLLKLLLERRPRGSAPVPAP